jgi:hypothetical protein
MCVIADISTQRWWNQSASDACITDANDSRGKIDCWTAQRASAALTGEGSVGSTGPGVSLDAAHSVADNARPGQAKKTEEEDQERGQADVGMAG